MLTELAELAELRAEIYLARLVALSRSGLRHAGSIGRPGRFLAMGRALLARLSVLVAFSQWVAPCWLDWTSCSHLLCAPGLTLHAGSLDLGAWLCVPARSTWTPWLARFGCSVRSWAHCWLDLAARKAWPCGAKRRFRYTGAVFRRCALLGALGGSIWVQANAPMTAPTTRLAKTN